MPYTYEYPHPAVTTDVVLFTIREDRLELLLIQRANDPFRGAWALPGGFLDIDEDLQPCAARELEEETGVRDVYLEQLYTFGTPGRDPRERIITVAYLALLPEEHRGDIRADSDAEAVAWFPLDRLPPLAFDHNQIVDLARRRLAAKLNYSTIALKLLPPRFTLGRLQAVYETILGRKLDKRNFRKQMLALGCIEDSGAVQRNGHHRPARLYQVKAPGQIQFSR